MSDGNASKGLRERLTSGTEDRLGRALTDFFDNPLLSGALGRAADAREKATQAQELAMGALNLPSAADVERLTRRLRSVSQRLEGIEDGVHRIGRSLASQSVEERLRAIEEQLGCLSRALAQLHGGPGAAEKRAPAERPARASAVKPAASKARSPATSKAAAERSSTGNRAAPKTRTSKPRGGPASVASAGSASKGRSRSATGARRGTASVDPAAEA